MKVALVHDFLNQIGGAEKVLQVFHELFPRAPIFTITHDQQETGDFFAGWDIRTSFIQNIPGGVSRYKWFLALFPAAIERLDLTKYDLIVSDATSYSKGVVTRPDAHHICYCHSPTRYLWSDTHNYTEELKQPGVIKQMLPLFLNRIRVWDRLAAERVDEFIANSKTVQMRIKKYYNRDSTVIYPPVEAGKFSLADKIEDYYLIVSRLRPYKRVDLAVEAFNALELPLKIIGTGEELDKLKNMARPNIEFLGPLPDAERNKYLSRCKAFIYPQEEDFGISALEAMASGRPVIAFKKGGACETVIENKTGRFFEEQTPWDLVDAVRNFKVENYDAAEIRQFALNFDTKLFKERIKRYIEKSYANHLKQLAKFYERPADLSPHN